ncbi:hypothetical protein SAMN05216553_101797 [Lentzea fradiae]|uniref:Uncharacterized protein n=1 Tax=Lentzea fradiae TaxID=200378 RepID=A0A1G7LD71_9PSEU|nr:hypothetical protein [Lentzea fradiae]SDF47341.1 hypothetical protein SAMN05216553_101797 [Lentzea fradiae]
MKLHGVLAVRQSWCRPGEPILLCAGTGSLGFDLAGLDWRGRPERGGLGKVAGALGNVAAGVVDAALAGSGPEDGGADTPHVVAWGPRADGIATRLCQPVAGVSWLVLTPHRLGRVALVEEPAEPEPEKSLLGRVSGLAKSARDIFGGKSPYPPHQPIATAEVTTVAEVGREHIGGVAPAERKLPRQYQTRDVHALRVSFVDGSGVDVLTSSPENARRLLVLANGQG